MVARERDGHVRIVICRRGTLESAAFIPDATGVYRCFRCGAFVVLVGMESTWVLAGTVDAICQECSIELHETMGLFQPEDRVSHVEL